MVTRDLVIAGIGDSQLDALSIGGCPPTQNWIALLADLVADDDAVDRRVRSVNLGHSGDTSTTTLGRVDRVLGRPGYPWIPSIAVVQPGVNDPGNGINQAATQANIQAHIKALKFGATGRKNDYGRMAGVTAATPSALPASGERGARFVVLTDNNADGGLDPATGCNVAGTGTQTVWECHGKLSGVRGWGRVTKPNGTSTPDTVQRILVLGAPYLNFTTGGDTLVAEFATYVGVRAGQLAAATAESVDNEDGDDAVVFVDLYAFMKARIQAGTDLDFSAVAYDQTRSPHYTLNNQHFSIYGHWLVAQACFEAIPAEWLSNI